MKVLYLAPPRKHADRLTAFSFVDEEIIALSRAGIEVFVLTYPVAGGSYQAPHPGVHLRVLPSGKSSTKYLRTLQLLWKARRIVPVKNWLRPRILYHMAGIERFAADVVRAEDIDVVHSNFGWPGGYGGVLARLTTGKPLVATMRGMDVLVDRDLEYGLRIRRAYDLALRVLLKNADTTTHVSDFIRQRAIELGARRGCAKTVKKGVDCEHFKRRDAWRKVQPRPMILTVGGLIRRKGIDTILEALGRLVESRDFNFVVVGKGPELSRLEALCDKLGLRSRTCFKAYVDRGKIQRLFAASDIFVLGSIWEGSGNVLLEALASSCPVICTDSGGPPEYIVDGETGFVVPVRDSEAMAERIGILLDDPKLREKLARQARAHAETHLRYSRMIDDIVGVYRSLAVGQPTDTISGSVATSAIGTDPEMD